MNVAGTVCLTPAAVFEKLATIQMVEVWIPMLDGRWLVMLRHTQPDKDVQAVTDDLARLKAAPEAYSKENGR